MANLVTIADLQRAIEDAGASFNIAVGATLLECFGTKFTVTGYSKASGTHMLVERGDDLAELFNKVIRVSVRGVERESESVPVVAPGVVEPAAVAVVEEGLHEGLQEGLLDL